MRKFLLLFIALTASLAANAFYYNNLYYYPDYNGGCDLRGFDPNYVLPSSITLNIPSYAYDKDGNKYEVRRIANDAFKGYAEIEHVFIPATVETIGAAAFKACINLQELIMYPSTKEIGNEAFYGCISLKALNTSAEAIGTEAFRGCVSLSAVNLGYPMKYIEPGAFMGCTALTNIDIPFSVERIGNGVGYLNFKGVFEDCISLMAVTFSYNLSDKKPRLKSVGYNTFKNCINLKRLDFPYSVTSIQTDAFLRCTSLKHIEWGGPEELRISKTDFTGVPLSRIVCHGNIRLSDYRNFQQLTELVQVRYDTYATEVQGGIYKNLSTLKEVHLDNVTKISSSAFMNCTGLRELTLSPELEEIGDNAFTNCILLKSIQTPNNLTRIGGYAFRGCKNLQKITLNENLQRIYAGAFMGCHALNEITIPMSVNYFLGTALDSCINLKSITIGGPQPLNTSRIAQHSPVESLTLRGNITGSQFKHLKSLKKVIFSDYCDEIGSSAFNGCTELTDVDFSNIKTIRSWAFSDCTGLTSTDLSSVEVIENAAFNNCTNLANVKFGDKITKIPDCLSNSGISALNIPDNVTSFTTPANCESLTTVTIGDGVTQCNGGFAWCTSLQNIRFGKNTASVYLQPKSVRKITCANPVPPKASNFQKDVYELGELIVPIGAADAYRNAQYWKNFYKITEVDMAGVEDIITDSDAPDIKINNGYIEIDSQYPVSIYSIDGKLVNMLSPGNHHIDLPHGMYILSAGTTIRKFCL